MNINPYKKENGEPIEGKLDEFIEWENNQFITHLKSLPLKERVERIDRSLRFAHRMQAEATETPDFETWKKEAIKPFEYLLKA